jgi:myo-inositol-1(or 4)-monophosphatase
MAHEVSLASKQSVADKNIGRVLGLVSRCQGIRSYGSAALTLCFVACGIIDAYQVDDLQPWDIAAGALIIREAGGIVMDTSGGDYDIMKPNVITACTPALAATVLEIVREVQAEIAAKKEQ